MMKERFYIFDRQSKGFVRWELTVKRILLLAARWAVLSLAVAVVLYILFALVWNTDHEKELIAENRQMREDIAVMRERLSWTDSIIADIRRTDRTVYNELFGIDPPQYETDANDALMNAFGMIMKSESELISESALVLRDLGERSAGVGRDLEVIFRALDSLPYSLKAIPSTPPLRNLTPLQAGATAGQKVSPFQKTFHFHTGIDLMAPSGSDVLCTADGYVSGVLMSDRSMGNCVTVTHSGGYTTTYNHLDEIRVSLGRRLRQGDVLGTVGSSGSQFAVSLHYEVLLNGEYQDPSCYFFAGFDPETYRKIVITARATGQSMD